MSRSVPVRCVRKDRRPTVRGGAPSPLVEPVTICSTRRSTPRQARRSTFRDWFPAHLSSLSVEIPSPESLPDRRAAQPFTTAPSSLLEPVEIRGRLAVRRGRRDPPARPMAFDRDQPFVTDSPAHLSSASTSFLGELRLECSHALPRGPSWQTLSCPGPMSSSPNRPNRVDWT